MAHEQLKHSALNQSLSELIGDIADLIQKEFRLAKAGIAAKLTIKIQGIVWLIAAVVLGFVSVLLMVQALVLGIASFGIAMHWACLIVAIGFFVVAALAFIKGRSDASESVMPTKSLKQITSDIVSAATPTTGN